LTDSSIKIDGLSSCKNQNSLCALPKFLFLANVVLTVCPQINCFVDGIAFLCALKWYLPWN